MIESRAETRVSVPARLRTVAARAPHAHAVVEGAAAITYAGLVARADAMATHLRALAPGGDARVVLVFQHKLPAIVAMMACASAGLAFVSVDAGDPEDRLRQIVRDCDPAAIVAEPALVKRARELAPPGLAVVDADTLAARGAGAAAPVPDVPADTLLYLGYTSGSTGQPKGVRQTHGNVVAYSDTYAVAMRVAPSARMSLIHTLSFGAAYTDVFGALLQGATLCAYDTRGDGVRDLADWLDRERIAVFHCVPTVFRELCRRVPPRRVLPWLRALDVSGETMFGRDLAQFRAHTHPDCRLMHKLASTEASVVAYGLYDHATSLPDHAALPVGRCPPTMSVRVERPDGTAAAVGEFGEIVVESPVLTPGYWRRPELDAERFTAGTRAGWRQWRPGDHGSLDAGGVLRFAGREETRAKIRGHTVHLSEVEAAMAAQPGVVQVGAVAHPATLEGDERIVAFVVSTQRYSESGLRDALTATLPGYMLPSRIGFVDALPMTATGKLDRAALAKLPVPEAAASEGGAPRDDVERAIAAVFGRLLNRRNLGRDADFFVLGGDSLLAAELQADLDDLFGTQVATLHRNSSVAGVAAEVRRAVASRGPRKREYPVLLPLWAQGSRTPLYVLHGRNGQAFVSPQFMQLLGDDQPVWAFQARGLEPGVEPHATLEAMAADYLAELRRVRPHGPYWLASMCAGGLVAAIMARELVAAGETVLPLLLLDPPDELVAGDMMRMSDEEFIAFTRQRGAERPAAGPMRSPAYLRAVHRVSRAFDDALRRYRPAPYSGRVFLLSSQARYAATRSAAIARFFDGPVERFAVGESHHDAVNPANPAFVAAFHHCVAATRRIEAAATAGGADAAAPFAAVR